MSIANQVRSEVVDRRTYRRPTTAGLESRAAMLHRSHYVHQRRLHEQMVGGTLSSAVADELALLHRLAHENKVSTSGRVRWLGGTDYAFKRSSCLFNCSYLGINTVYDVVDAFWLLLNGCGVGFSPQPGTLRGFNRPKYYSAIYRANGPSYRGRETNLSHVGGGDWRLGVGDSAAAWAKFVGKLFADDRRDGPETRLVVDFSEIRGPGERLAGYGWICAGSAGLRAATTKIVDLLNARAGWLLSAADIVDVTNLMGTVLSTRRSAEIAMLSAHHPEAGIFERLKGPNLADHPHRTQSNNSVVFQTKPPLRKLFDLLTSNLEGYDIGFVNGEAALRRAPWFQGLNPCFHPDTLIPVVGGGLCRIGILENREVEVWDGNGMPQKVTVRKTGLNAPLLRVLLSDGHTIRVTPYHTFVRQDGTRVQARELAPGDELRAEFVTSWGVDHDPGLARQQAWQIADGTWYNRSSSKSKVYLYGDKRKHIGLFQGLKRWEEQDRTTVVVPFGPLPKDRVPDWILQSDEETQLAFLDSYLDADGHVDRTDKGLIVQICSVHESFLQDVQSMLYNLGVKSSLRVTHEAGLRNMPGGTYYCQTLYRLTVTNPARLLQHIRPDMVDRGPYEVSHRVYVESVESCGESDVFCFTVPTTNSFLLGNIEIGQCAEILLPNHGFCNLSEINLPAFGGNLAALESAARILGRANYRQTCVDLRDGILQPAWHQTNQTLRLCGVGITGITACPWLTPYVLRRIRQAAWAGACSVADEYGTPRPAAVTTIKPSGTLSKVFGVPSGCHQPVSRYELNTIVFDEHDPLVSQLRTAGFTVFDHPTQPHGVLAEFPIDNGPGVIENETAIQQLERYRMLMENWCDYNVSITVSYEEDEIPDIVSWLDRNWDNFVAVSWMRRVDPWMDPASIGQKYLPQRALTADEFRAKASGIRPIEWESFRDSDQQFDIEDAAECAGGACPVR